MKSIRHDKALEFLFDSDDILLMKSKRLESKIITRQGEKTKQDISLEYRAQEDPLKVEYFPPESHEYNAAVIKIFFNELVAMSIEQAGVFAIKDKESGLAYILHDEQH